MDVCDHLPEADRPAPPHVPPARAKWCEPLEFVPDEDSKPQTCKALFEGYDTGFKTAWDEERASTLASLPALDLSGRDLRRANPLIFAAQKTSVRPNSIK